MNEQALLHLQNSQYSYASDCNTVELTFRASAQDKFDAITLIYGCKYEYYKKQSRTAMKKRFTDGKFDYYAVSLALDDVRLLYIFELSYGGKIYYFSEAGLTETYDYALSAYDAFQLPYINSADVMPVVSWLRTAVFYEIFVDRFYRGDLKKNADYINLKWGEIPNPKSFAGGDLKGITAKLDYLKSLGINAVYLTPVFKSVSNHKYDISDYFEIDGCFGDKETLRKLVCEAHARGMKIVLDAVFNHCSENLAQFQDVLARGKESPYFEWFIIKGDKINEQRDNYECFGFCRYMPKFNASNPEVQKFLLGVATYWLKEFKIDGWRLDVSDEVANDFWHEFRKTIKFENPDCVILGENWHDASAHLRGDKFDGIMNYALTKACMDYFVSGALSAEEFANRLSGLYLRNTKQANAMMLNLLDSHDTHRFYTLLNKNKNKLLCALALIYLHTGAPCVYYGTEVCAEGGYDPDCRRTMDWSDSAAPDIRASLASFASLRSLAEVSHGEISFYSRGELFVLERMEKGVLRLVINNSEKQQVYCAEGKVLLGNNYSCGELLPDGFVIEYCV
ncbi:glycoside hydrolase family 13 protein [Pumilibacter muris]|uniref:glycoside hydrolase family 13 protein n=1 Tax=Pumilibacter muris TaxID=2941510 RepID=UPI002041505C|nr:glycoside hydrolase family 13 protein [Pumilibacter muris]